MRSHYANQDDSGIKHILVCDNKPDNCQSLIAKMKRVRCLRCWTYEWKSLLDRQVIPTMTYDPELKRIDILHLCMHNVELITSVLKQVIAENYTPSEFEDIRDPDTESLVDVYVNKLNFMFWRDERSFNLPKVFDDFVGVNLHFDTRANPGELGLNDFMEFISAFQYNFKTVQLLVNHEEEYKPNCGHGFLIEEYGRIATVPVITPWLMHHLTKIRNLTRLDIVSFGQTDIEAYKHTVYESCRLKILHIEDIIIGDDAVLSEQQIVSIVTICLAFRKTLVNFSIRDPDAILVIKKFFQINFAWPCLRHLAIFYDRALDDPHLSIDNRFNFPVLTTVNFFDTDWVYEPNPPIINQQTMKIYQPRSEDLYSFLVTNRRNLVAAKVWEIIATNYIGRAYKISPDIRRMISHMITHVDTGKLGFVEPDFSGSQHKVLSLKRIHGCPELPSDVIYCVDDASKKKWDKISKIKATAEKHQKRRQKLTAEIADLKVELKEDSKSKLKRIKKAISQKRERIEALETYENKLESKLKKLK